ncbi:hypothetical protein [Leptotrichia hongkongensis]|uniref:hypothetical protein n=1 Tax=Leptotrichia hongkongensis TaxID=554406 RepID=UPI0035A9236C
MKTEAKELIQEGLKLFSLYDRRALKRFYLSAEKNEADLSYLDEKYQTYTRAKAKGMFLDLALGFLDAFASAGSPVMVIDNTKSERYNEKKLILRYKIKDFLEETNVDDNTGYLLSMIEFYCQ